MLYYHPSKMNTRGRKLHGRRMLCRDKGAGRMDRVGWTGKNGELDRLIGIG